MSQIKQQTVVAQVMAAMREFLASGTYSPGDKFPTEKELAERFGIGRSSIREAIKIFNYLGILESRAAVGTFVKDRSHISSEALTWSLLLGNDEIEEIIDLRGGMELWCLLKLTGQRPRGEERARELVETLHTIVNEMESSARQGFRESLIEDDFRFHRAIIHSAQNPLFSSFYETLRSFLHDEIKRSQEDYDDPLQICREHRQLAEVIARGERGEVVALYCEHIDNIKARLSKNTRKKNPPPVSP